MTTNDSLPVSLTPPYLDRLAELALGDSLAFERFLEQLITYVPQFEHLERKEDVNSQSHNLQQ